MESSKRLNRELVQKGTIIDIYKDTIQTPENKVVYYDFIGHKGAAAVVAVTNDNKILMVKQYRNAIDAFTLEIPAGGKDGIDEHTKTCAARELEEETGYKSYNLEFLIGINTSVAFCNEKIDIYVAKDLIPSSQNLDEDEFIDVKAYFIEELIEFIFSGEITDAKTIAGLLAYKEKYK
ncbi:MAG: NUDIX hydrolase [Clostridiales bacterium]|nr:NUDIX hydrolase [Clostridiales bacterium]